MALANRRGGHGWEHTLCCRSLHAGSGISLITRDRGSRHGYSSCDIAVPGNTRSQIQGAGCLPDMWLYPRCRTAAPGSTVREDRLDLPVARRLDGTPCIVA